MERIEVELFTDASVDAVVRLPPRRFPGLLVQGDSLSSIRDDVAGIVRACNRGDVDEAGEEAAFLLSNLDEMLASYTVALNSHDIPIPFYQAP